MKKLLLAAVVLALVVGGAFAQDWTSSTSPDTTYIILQADLVGLQYTINNGGVGDENGDPWTSATFSGSFSVSADSFYAAATDMKPCELLHYVFWIENTGGVTANFDLLGVDRGGLWTEDGSADADACTGLGEDEYVIGYVYTSSDNNASTPASGSIDFTTVTTGSEIDDIAGGSGLVAEDPSAAGNDGTWASQIDQAELHVGWRMPSSTSDATDVNHIGIRVEGEVNGED